ncbi:L-threonine 3-dehydrogenase [bacterium]|nr:L-threonine 3-dehydrogenase [bacterium]
MKALVKAKNEPGLWLQDVPVPEIGPGDVLIRVQKTGICGTDLHIYLWDEWAQKTIPTPMVVGHEFVGIVDKVGEMVTAVKPGDRVSAEGHVVCGRCRNCMAGSRHLCAFTKGIGVNRPGSFAEYVSVPESNVWKCHPDIPDDLYAIFDPLGNATHTALSYDLVGEDVLITGAGPIGAMAAAVARKAGARHVVITDVNPYRLELAKKLGATATVNVTSEKLEDVQAKLGMTEGFDVGLEMSGHPSGIQTMVANMRHGGSIALLGILPSGTGLDWDKVIFKGLKLKGIYGREMYETWYKMTALLQNGMDIDPIITHRLPYHEFEKGFTAMKAGQSGKVVLDWSVI